jgi:hypothetical protein
MKTVIMFAVIAMAFAFTGKDILTGRWESKPSKNGNVTGVVFKADQTIDGYINRKPFVTGSYTLNGDMITLLDNGCAGVPGTYKLIFFSNADSLRFELISDSCAPRSKGMPNLVMGRVK